MQTLLVDDVLAIELTDAIQAGNVKQLQKLLEENPGTATVRIVAPNGDERALLLIATDWPGHFDNVAATIGTLVAAGADVDSRFVGSHRETPLHWAASCDDVDAVDALLDAGANVEADGSCLDNGTPLSNAVNFGQWNAARRLVERGANTSLGTEAALGLLDRIKGRFDGDLPSQEAINYGFWMSCSTGQRDVVEFLHGNNASLNWIPHWDNSTPLDAASKGDFESLVSWLREQGARTAEELSSTGEA